MTLELLTMTPEPCVFICCSAARVQRKVPFRVTSRTRIHCSSVMSTSSAVPPSPALLTMTSSRPCSFTTEPTRWSTCSWMVTSQTMPRTPSVAAVSARRRSCQSEATTVAPSSSAFFAVAKPMPVPAAAVTTTTLSVSRPWPVTYSGIGEPLQRGLGLGDDAGDELLAGRQVVDQADHLPAGHDAEVGTAVDHR